MANLLEKHLTQIILLAMSLALVAVLVVNVGAYSSGITGKSQTGCGQCHSPNQPGLGTTVTITGLPIQYTPDENYSLTITVTSDDVPGTKGGFDLSVTAGSLSTTDPNAQIVSATEAMHQGDNARSWQVNWTAPTGGEVTFNIAGLAADGDGTFGGDVWNLHQYSITATVTEGNVLPIAVFTYTSTGLTVEFTDQSYDPDGNVTSRSWKFGDGSSSNSTNPTHTFPVMDTYNVILTVTDDRGDSGVASEIIMLPSKGERTQIWMTQVAVVSVAIAFLSFVAVGIARKMGGKEGR